MPPGGEITNLRLKIRLGRDHRNTETNTKGKNKENSILKNYLKLILAVFVNSEEMKDINGLCIELTVPLYLYLSVDRRQLVSCFSLLLQNVKFWTKDSKAHA